MKLEKREITLNEKDSLKDAFFTYKTLLTAYVDALLKTENKQTQAQLFSLLKEVGEDALFVRDLLSENAALHGDKQAE